ncbi:MAG: biopolymer transporter ExbD [Proteobacteria bacterium]|nr:biopolymer transporter ExbD [Pseudomonadota bacterium]
MRRLIEEEELNLQDLIFILLFFFVISQTLIVFKVQKDIIVPPKVDKNPDLVVNKENNEIITVIIDELSGVSILAGEKKKNVLTGFNINAPDATYADYYDPVKGKELFLPTEESQAYRKLILDIKEYKSANRFKMPRVGLIADHRARYGTIFQVNVAIQELIKENVIDPTVKWKVFVDKKETPPPEF